MPMGRRTSRQQLESAIRPPVPALLAEHSDPDSDGGGPSHEHDHEKHPFSELWEDSDLILVVEDDKFHVHRQILSIHSPVFKAMLNSQFKEATAKEIPLPGKKASEFLDFLKQLYVKENAGVTIWNVEHILKLADEYQVNGVIDQCIKCLQEEPKHEFNVIQILYLSNHSVIAKGDVRLEAVRQQCYRYIQSLELENIVSSNYFNDLEKETMKTVLTKKAEHLEKLLKKIYPQFVGLLEYCMWLCHQKKKADLQWCPLHYVAGVSSGDICKRISQCSVCRKMILLMISQSYNVNLETAKRCYCYGGKFHFGKDLIPVLGDLEKVYVREGEEV